MKTLILGAAAGCLLAGCAMTETGSTHRTPGGTTVYGLNDQPQSATAGEGSLMPGAYDSRQIQTGTFTGRERTNDQIGQRPVLPREADPRGLDRSGAILSGRSTGVGTLGQTGIVPDRPVSNETILQEPAEPAPAAIPIEEDEAVGGPAQPEVGTGEDDSSEPR